MRENEEFTRLLVEAGENLSRLGEIVPYLRRVAENTIKTKINWTIIEAIQKLILSLADNFDDSAIDVICDCLEYLFKSNKDSASLTNFFSEWKRILESLFELTWKTNNKNESTLKLTQLLTTFSKSYGNWEDISLIFLNVIKMCNLTLEPVFIVIKSFVNVLRMKRPKVSKSFLLKNMKLLEGLRNLLFTIGDFDLQIDVLEVLLILIFPYRLEITKDWFLEFGEEVNEIYLNSSFRVLEHGARPFLNKLNQALGENQLVFSIKCQSCDIGGNELDPPSGEQTSEGIWIDVNLNTDRLTITCADFENEASGSIVLSLPFESIMSINVDIQNDELMISLQSDQLEHMGLSKNIETEYIIITANTIENGVEHVDKFFSSLYKGCEGKHLSPNLETITTSLYTGIMENLSAIVSESNSPKFFLSKGTFFPIRQPDPETPRCGQTTPLQVIQEAEVSSTESKRKHQSSVKRTSLELCEKYPSKITPLIIKAVGEEWEVSKYQLNESIAKMGHTDGRANADALDIENITEDIIEGQSVVNGTPRSSKVESLPIECDHNLQLCPTENGNNPEISSNRGETKINTPLTEISEETIPKNKTNELPDTTFNNNMSNEINQSTSPTFAHASSLMVCKIPHVTSPAPSGEHTPTLTLSVQEHSVNYKYIKKVAQAKPKEKMPFLPSRLLPIKAKFDGIDVNIILGSQKQKAKPSTMKTSASKSIRRNPETESEINIDQPEELKDKKDVMKNTFLKEHNEKRPRKVNKKLFSPHHDIPMFDDSPPSEKLFHPKKAKRKTKQDATEKAVIVDPQGYSSIKWKEPPTLKRPFWVERLSNRQEETLYDSDPYRFAESDPQNTRSTNRKSNVLKKEDKFDMYISAPDEEKESTKKACKTNFQLNKKPQRKAENETNSKSLNLKMQKKEKFEIRNILKRKAASRAQYKHFFNDEIDSNGSDTQNKVEENVNALILPNKMNNTPNEKEGPEGCSKSDKFNKEIETVDKKNASPVNDSRAKRTDFHSSSITTVRSECLQLEESTIINVMPITINEDEITSSADIEHRKGESQEILSHEKLKNTNNQSDASPYGKAEENPPISVNKKGFSSEEILEDLFFNKNVNKEGKTYSKKLFYKRDNPSQLEQLSLREKLNKSEEDSNNNFEKSESGPSKSKDKVRNIKIIHENIYSSPVELKKIAFSNVNTMMSKKKKGKRKLEPEIEKVNKKMKTETRKKKEKPKWKKDVLSFYETGHLFGNLRNSVKEIEANIGEAFQWLLQESFQTDKQNIQNYMRKAEGILKDMSSLNGQNIDLKSLKENTLKQINSLCYHLDDLVINYEEKKVAKADNYTTRLINKLVTNYELENKTKLDKINKNLPRLIRKKA